MSDLLNKASLVVIPSGYKEDTVYSVVPSDGSGDLSFTRASNGTRVNSAGLVEVCPWNLLQYSEDFTNAYWNKFQSTITANAITAPNGTTTADKLEYTTTGTAVLYATSSALQNQVYALSCYAKQGTTNILQIGFTLGGGDKIANFNLNTGVISTTSSGVTASIESVGDGWYRCIMSLTTDINTPNVFINSTSGTTGNYIYIWGAQLNIGSTAKPYFPTTDRLNVPRLTYQNGGGGCPSLLLEKQSTNLWYYSEQFDNSEWLKTECTITANSVISPDGTQNADKITDTTANNEHRFRATSALFTITTSTTFSIFAKAGEYSKFGIADLSNGYIVKFDLSAGTIISTGTDWSNAKIENFGNGWYRLSATRSTNATCGYAMLNDSGDFVFTGTGTKGVYIWGAQCEASSHATSYIPTTSASATRVADACSKTGISSLIGQSEGVMFWEGSINTLGSGAQLCDLNADGNKFIQIYNSLSGSTPTIGLYIQNVSLLLNIGNIATISYNTNFKFALGYKNNDYVAYLNGTQVYANTTIGVPPTSNFGIGRTDQTAEESGKKVNQVALFKTRLTNAELASLTTI